MKRDRTICGKDYEQINKEAAAPDPTRIFVLKQAAQLTGVDRQAIYGDSVTNMTHFAGLLQAYFSEQMHNQLHAGGFSFTAQDAAVIMVLAKLSRTSVGKFHLDNFIDAAAYIAIAAECGISEQEMP